MGQHPARHRGRRSAGPVAGAILLAATAGVIAVSILGARIGRFRSREGGHPSRRVADQVVETVRSAPELVAFGRQDLITAGWRTRDAAPRTAALRQALGRGIARALATWAAGAGLIGVVLAGLHHRAGSSQGSCSRSWSSSRRSLDQGYTPAALTDGYRERGREPPRELAGFECRSRAARRREAHQSEGAAAVLDHVEVLAPGARRAARARPTPSRRPRPDRPILHDVSLTVAPGRRVALIGRSGAGKSSALHVLLHFLEPSSGSARIGESMSG